MIFFEFVFVGTGTGIKSVGPAFRYQFDQIVITFQVLCKDNQVITALVDSSPTNRKAIDLVDDGSTYFPRCGILVGKPTTGYVHFTPEYRFEYFGFEFCLFFLQGGQFFFFVFCLFRTAFDGFDSFLYTFNGIFCRSVFLFYQIEKLFYPEHITVVGQCQTFHSVAYSLIDQCRNRSLTVKNRILGVNVQMNKGLHKQIEFSFRGLKLRSYSQRKKDTTIENRRGCIFILYPTFLFYGTGVKDNVF